MDLDNTVNRVRILIGDTDIDAPFFDDAIYQWYLDSGLSEIETGIELLESAINQIALNPTRERAGSFEVYGQNVEFLNKRLQALKAKRYGKNKVPVIVNPGQSSWQKIEDIFEGDW